jgi:hypothetical protein
VSKLLWALSLCGLLGATPAGGADEPAQGGPVLEWRGQYGGESVPAAEVITNAAQWARLWRRLDKPVPPVDFTVNCAVVAFAGRRPTGGFLIEFLEPRPEGDGLLIRWRVRRPAPDAYVTQALAQPWRVKLFPRPRGVVKAEQVVD